MNPELPAHVDPAWCDPELDRAVLALAVGELAPALDLLAATRDQQHRRELCVGVLGQAGSVTLPALSAAAQRRRDDADLLLLWGSALSSAAWTARGSAFAKHTTDEQFGRLIDLTKQARATLRRAAALAPDDAAPWSVLMWCALGAPEHDGEGTEVFRQVERRVPDLSGANEARLQMLAAKWGGSHDAMLEFARKRTADLPPGHPVLALVASAHIEVYLNTLGSGNFIKRIWKSMSYLGKEEVRAEVNAASDRLLAGAQTTHPAAIAAHQTFAAIYLEADDDVASQLADRVRLARHLAYSGDRPALWPWGYFNEPSKQFAKAHKRAAGFR